MDQEEYLRRKTEYLKDIQEQFIALGNIIPQMTLLVDRLEKQEDKPIYTSVIVPIPNAIMETDQTKQFFLTTVIPEIHEKLKSKDFIFKGVCWASEAWVRRGMKDDEEHAKVINDGTWKDLPIEKEVLITTIQTATQNECMIYEIKRGSPVVNADGNLIDSIELTLNEELSDPTGMHGGIFSNLYERFIPQL